MEGVEIVQEAEPCGGRPGEFQADEPAAGLQDAVDFPETLLPVGQVPDAEPHHRGVEGAGGEGGPLRVSLDIEDSASLGGVRRFVSSRLHHRPVDVIQDDPPGRADPFRGKDREVARPAADVEDRFALLQLQKLDGRSLPEIMDPEAQQGVHQVVSFRHRVEVASYEGALFAGGDPAESEIGQPLLRRRGRSRPFLRSSRARSPRSFRCPCSVRLLVIQQRRS